MAAEGEGQGWPRPRVKAGRERGPPRLPCPGGVGADEGAPPLRAACRRRPRACLGRDGAVPAWDGMEPCLPGRDGATSPDGPPGATAENTHRQVQARPCCLGACTGASCSPFSSPTPPPFPTPFPHPSAAFCPSPSCAFFYTLIDAANSPSAAPSSCFGALFTGDARPRLLPLVFCPFFLIHTSRRHRPDGRRSTESHPWHRRAPPRFVVLVPTIFILSPFARTSRHR